MESMKDWLLGKCKDASNQVLQGKPTTSNFVNKVVTPKNIPEFTIPGLESSDPGISSRLSDTQDGDTHSQSSDSICSSPRLSPVQRGSSPSLMIPAAKHPKSAPTSPSRTHSLQPLNEKDSISLDHINRVGDDTNADPSSTAAMGLDHFKSRTPFGFSTLSESPHTLRRESLFHPMDGRAPLNKPRYKQGERKAKSRENINELNHNREIQALALRRTASLTCAGNRERANIPFLVEPSGGSPSRETVQRTSPLALSGESAGDTSPERSYVDNGRYLSEHGFRRSSRRNRLYYRRRSSLPGLDPDQAKQLLSGSDSHTDNSSTETSPSFRRRSNGTIEPCGPAMTTGHSYPAIRSTSLTDSSGNIIYSKSSEAISKLQAHLIAEQGEIKISFKYLPETRQLCVTLIRAENLGGLGRSEHVKNSYAKVCLIPGKIQKQTSDVVKNTNNPSFNQAFYFKDLWMEELSSMRIRIQVFHKENLRRDEFLGEVQVSLAAYSLLQENRMWKDLEPKVENENLGYIEVGLRFDPKANRLVVSVIRAAELIPHSTRIAPNPYVKVELSEPGKQPVKKQTRAQKKTKSPHFQTYFEFTISPKLDDLNYTSVTFTVYDHEKIRSDEAIGQVRIGYGATEDKEHAHWVRTLLNPEKEIVEWHTLMEIEKIYS